MPAFTYYAAKDYVDCTLKPYKWYLNHVIIGAEEASLPETYVQAVRAIESLNDPFQEREKSERKLYNQGDSERWRQPGDELEHPSLMNCEHSQS